MKRSGREQLWIALSNFYLDNELDDYHYRQVAAICNEYNFSFDEAKNIDKTEVFPTLYSNLLSIAGIWDGFDEDWLVEQCSRNQLQKDRVIFKCKSIIKTLLAGHFFKENWKNFDRVVSDR
ncbi:hypothetical protein ABN763_07060 [Spongiivirga sp. MCCC 1A20706]|uniref:DUF7079 family protein n=1 Tax=Spongiivirga sp. MCCC 1A20706 TaxID=3160963 RepID=UPI003977D94B